MHQPEHLPLTVVDSDEETAGLIREALDGLVDHYSEDVTEAVAGLVVERGVRASTIREYLGAQRQTYRRHWPQPDANGRDAPAART